jgi:hypothetical protein
MPLAAPPPPVTVVIDRHDDAIHTHTALAAHHPPSGRITLHPGPGTTSETGLAHDLLAALGKPPLLPGRFPGGRQPAWEAATAWITALPVTRLTVLRAHRLTARRTMRLLELRALTGTHLTLVCHRPHLPAALHQALRTVDYSVTADFEAARRPCTAPCTPPPIIWRHRPPPVPITAHTAQKVAHRLHAATAHPRLAAAVAAALFTSASLQQLATARPRDYDDAAATLALHDRARYTDGCATHPVPPWASVFLRAAACFSRLVSNEDQELLAAPGDRAHLLRGAETARLRPPQPPTARRKGPVGRVEWDWRERQEAERYEAIPAGRARPSRR